MYSKNTVQWKIICCQRGRCCLVYIGNQNKTHAYIIIYCISRHPIILYRGFFVHRCTSQIKFPSTKQHISCYTKTRERYKVQATKTKKSQIAEIIHVEANFGTVVGKGVLSNILKVLMGGGSETKVRGASKCPIF